MLTDCNEAPTAQWLNSVVDSLYLRVMRQCIPSDWLKEKLPQWQNYQATADFDSLEYVEFIPDLGGFELLPFGKRPYRYILRNKEVATIHIWCPEKWETAISSQTGQFLVDFRSKFLQAHGVVGARKFIEKLCKALTQSITDGEPIGWERISRVDLATDTQVLSPPTWQGLDRYVSRARKKQGCSDAYESELKQAKKLLKDLRSQTPPNSNKGGGTYKLTAEDLDLLRSALAEVDSKHFEDNHVYSVCYARELQSVYFGRFSSALHAVRYDKLASLKPQKKEYLKDVWKENGWDGKSPVWRTEFRLTSPFLKQAGIELEDGSILQDLRDFKTFCKHIGCVWRYLTHEWLRLTIPDESDSNQWRWELDPEWLVIQQAFESVEAIKRYPELKNPIDQQMVAQMRGVALTLAARRAETDFDTDAAVDVLNDLATWFADEEFTLRLAERRELLGCDDFTFACLAHELRAEHLLNGEGS